MEHRLRRKDIFLTPWYGTHAKEKGYSLLRSMEHMLRRKDKFLTPWYGAQA